jgi:hypothetical protein
VTDFAIVSGADEGHAPLLADLMRSIRDKPEGRAVPLHVFDLGLKDATRERIAALATTVRDPGWDIDFPNRASAPTPFKAMTARPFLPDHFPGHRVYLWLDADTWVQDWRAIEIFLRAAAGGKLAAVAATDRSFCGLSTERLEERNRMNGQCYESGFGPEFARRHYLKPCIISGAFAIRANAPHWHEWRICLAQALQRWLHHLVEQTALNFAVYERGLPFASLPLYCDWPCNIVLPKYDPARALLVEPDEPHGAIGVVHLAGNAKRQELHEIESTAGGTLRKSLRYGGNSPVER